MTLIYIKKTFMEEESTLIIITKNLKSEIMINYNYIKLKDSYKKKFFYHGT